MKNKNFLPLAVALAALIAVGIAVWIYANPTRPAPYQNAPYYSRSFLNEQKSQPGQWVTPPHTQVMLPANYHGRWFNTLNGQRLTLGQPTSPAHTLWIFGGAAVYNAEVPDAFTFASQLQNALNKTNSGWRVENLGVPTTIATQQLQHLKLMPLKKDDTVLFFIGAEDALRPLPAAQKVSDVGNALDAAARYAKTYGAHFMVALQPMLYAQPQLSAYEQSIATPQKQALTETYAQLRIALPQLAAANGWDYADLSELLNGDDEYYVTCCTSNERAGARIADYLYRRLTGSK